MLTIVKPRKPPIFNNGKEIIATPRKGIKKGQINAPKTRISRSIPRQIPASPAVKVYTFGTKV